MSTKYVYLVAGMLLVALFTGCATRAPMGPKEEQGTVGGAVLGGLLGAIIGNNIGDNDNEAMGAAIGATMGGTVGGNYGRSQDQIDSRIAGMEQRMSTEVVTITNDNGSTSRVVLQKLSDGRYRGPHGEEYDGLPGEEQLKPVYGLKY